MTRKNPNKNIFTFSGALSKNDPSLQDYEPEAINYYQTIRNFTNDEYCDYVNTISTNSNFSYDVIDNMLQHLCFNEYYLNDGRYECFDEDPYIMFSLMRLYNGNYLNCDIVLIEHENMEYSLTQTGLTVGEAHSQTEIYHSYASAIKMLEESGTNLFFA